MAVGYNPSVVQSGLVFCVDAANKKSYSQNEFSNTTDIFAFSGTSANAATLSRDSISSPVGNTPLKMAISGNDPHWAAYNSAAFNIAPAANGQTWIVSVYVKASVATTGEIFIFNANASGDGFANNDYGATGISITTEWTRVQYVRTMNSVNTAFIQVRLDGTPSGGSGTNIWWDGLQVERVPSGITSPTPYTSKYYGGSVFKDLSGRNNTATLLNYPTYSSSNSGLFILDGTNDYADTGKTATQLGIYDADYTFDCWVYPTDLSSDKTMFGTVQTAARQGLHLVFRSGTIYQGHYGSDFGVGSATLNSWNHISYTYIKSTGLASIYKNGILQGTATISSFIGTTNILLASWASSYYFIGNGGNYKIYNRALSATEVLQNFNALRGRYGV